MPNVPTEAALLVLCSAIALALVGGVVWLVRHRQTRGRRLGRPSLLKMFRGWATSRQAAWPLGGLLLVVLAGWWALSWLHRQTPPGDENVVFVEVASGDSDGVEPIEVEAAIDSAARQKLVAERWQRGLPVLAAIGLLVGGLVALAQSGWLEHGRRSGRRVRGRL